MTNKNREVDNELLRNLFQDAEIVDIARDGYFTLLYGFFYSAFRFFGMHTVVKLTLG